MAEYIESVCRRCFHSYVCEQFNEHRDSNNEKCHFFNDHFVPAADVAPVVHGRWIPIKVPTGIELLGIKEMVVGFIRCSKCYMEFDISCEWYSHYCPNCGARMGGE